MRYSNAHIPLFFFFFFLEKIVFGVSSFSNFCETGLLGLQFTLRFTGLQIYSFIYVLHISCITLRAIIFSSFEPNNVKYFLKTNKFTLHTRISHFPSFPTNAINQNCKSTKLYSASNISFVRSNDIVYIVNSREYQDSPSLNPFARCGCDPNSSLRIPHSWTFFLLPHLPLIPVSSFNPSMARWKARGDTKKSNTKMDLVVIGYGHWRNKYGEWAGSG